MSSRFGNPMMGPPVIWSMVLKHGPHDSLPQTADRIATAVIDMMAEEGKQLRSTRRKLFIGEDGVWRRATRVETHWLRVAIQYGMDLSGHRYMTLREVTWKHLNKHPAIFSPGFDSANGA